jgi:phage minor structural protein
VGTLNYPILYSATENDFDHNGLGILGDCVSCEVTEEANGIFELVMQYPMDGIHFEDIVDRAIIKAKADNFRNPQLFRVYATSKPMSGVVTVLAEHISYDLSGIPVSPFSAESVSTAFNGLKNNAVIDCPFDFWTDKGTSGSFSVKTPASIRSRLGGAAGSILDVYGGEYEFDNYTVKLYNNRGMNRGVSIRYGKNMTDIQQEQNCASIATGIYPYWNGGIDQESVLVELPEKIVNGPGSYNFVKIRTVDFTESFETQPTVDQLRAKAESYVQNNNIGVPRVSLTVSFAQLEQSEEYKRLKLLERVSLFDTVNVEFPALGVSATAKAVKVVYDVLLGHVKSVSLGSVRANVADTIAKQQQEIKDTPSKSFMEIAVENLTKTILGAHGGAVRLLDDNNDGVPDTLYIADDPDPALAVKVWRFNYEGWGASKNGYNGPFMMGATLDDGLLAEAITAAQLVAGTIKSADNETFFLDLDNGILTGRFTSTTTREGYLPPTLEDVQNMLWALSFPDRFPVKDFYDLNGDGVFDRDDIILANRVFYGIEDIANCPSAFKTDVTVVVDPADSNKTIKISGMNMWGSYVETYFGVNGTNVHTVKGDLSVAGTNRVSGSVLVGEALAGNASNGKASELLPNKLSIGGTGDQAMAELSVEGSADNLHTRLLVDEINPGKVVLFTGACAKGSSCVVPNTDRFDLFAVYLGDGTTMEDTPVLCYKNGTTIRGIGGRAGTTSISQEMHLFEATVSDGTWTVEDASKHFVYIEGSISEQNRLQLMKVVGVI